MYLNRGMGLIGAIFLIVVIALISLAITRTVQSSPVGIAKKCCQKEPGTPLSRDHSWD